MVPCLLLLVFLVQYAVIYRKGRHRWQLKEKQQSTTVEDTLKQPEEVRLGREGASQFMESPFITSWVMSGLILRMTWRMCQGREGGRKERKTSETSFVRFKEYC